MALYFFDSSALVKRYVREQGSVWVRKTVEEDVIQRAVALMNTYPLRTADAIQVSTAILLSRTLHEVQVGPVIVASADDRVLQAASQDEFVTSLCADTGCGVHMTAHRSCTLTPRGKNGLHSEEGWQSSSPGFFPRSLASGEPRCH